MNSKIILIFLVMSSLFMSCSSAQKLQEKSPVVVGDAYCQSWVAGIKGGGSGINLFIPLSKEIPLNLILDSVYFRGKVTKLDILNREQTLFVGRFRSEFNQNKDIIMSNDSNEEYGNQAPTLAYKIPFDLKDSECVISYKNGIETLYFKIENIKEKQPEHYPSALPNKQ